MQFPLHSATSADQFIPVNISMYAPSYPLFVSTRFLFDLVDSALVFYNVKLFRCFLFLCSRMAIILFRIDHLLFEPKCGVFLILFSGKSEAVVRDVPLGLPATQRPGPDVVKATPIYSHKTPHRSGGGDNAGMPHACHGDLTNSSSEL